MRRSNYILVLFSALLFTTSLQAQTVKAITKALEEAHANKNHFGVMQYIQRLPVEQQQSGKYLNMYAEAAIQTFSYQEAERAYTSIAVSEFRADYPLNEYKLGLTKKYLGKYEEAVSHFERFLAESAPNDLEIKRANAQIDECLWAKESIENSDAEMNIKHFEKGVNSGYTDFGAIYSGDTLYFSSLRFEKEGGYDKNNPAEAFYSKILMFPPDGEAEEWDVPFNVGNNTNAHLSFSQDGKRVYFNRCTNLNATDYHCEIYYSERGKSGKWGKAVKLPDNINMPLYTSTQPSVGYDKARRTQVLFYASDRPGGEGGTDIWYSLMDKEGNWQDPVNLYSVNTSGGELTPFFHTPSQILYFSTDGRRTYGGFDIYKAIKKGRKFEQPIHMDPPLNSSFHDWHYSVNQNSTKGTFASNRIGGYYLDESTATCCNDIYEVELNDLLFKLKLRAFNTATGDELEGVTVSIDDGNDDPWVFLSDTVDMTDIDLQNDKEYYIVVSKAGFTSDTVDVVSTLGLMKSENFERNAYLTPSDVPNLIALVFDETTRDPINGAKVELIHLDELDNPIPDLMPEGQRKFDSNEYGFNIKDGKQYMLVAEKEGYRSDTSYISQNDIRTLNGATLVRELYLFRKPSDIPTLAGYMPLPLYFENDYPDPDSRKRTTKQSYKTVYNEYLSKKDEYVAGYTEGLSESQVEQRKEDMNRFFDQEVRLGYETLKGFFEHLETYLETGNTAKIVIKGYASPRADSHYNLKLTNRRTHSLLIYMRNYKDGIFVPYFNNGQITISERPYGESKAPRGISDEYDDPRSSIYSIDASRERRAEILEIIDNNLRR